MDVLGLVIAAAVLAANTHDNAAGIALLNQVAEHTDGTAKKALSTRASRTRSSSTNAGLSIDVEIVERNPRRRRSFRSPKRSRVEQCYGILIIHRHLVRDYEHYPASSAFHIYWAMTHVMARRLTDAGVPTWRVEQAVTG
ncbi:hypothetical protein [Streptomyces sp. B6B3]|uniref:hypothetical protein n=1 Tax=Streptomyces sp. B6B3 TaxID=3153570 RepID=UPI00325DF698